MKNEKENKSYLEFQPEELTDKTISELPTEPFIIADEDIFHIAEFQVIGENKIKISLPDFTSLNVERFIENDFYGSAVLYMSQIEIIKDLVRLNSDDISDSSIRYISSEELNYEIIVESQHFNKVAQIYERVYYCGMYMEQAYQNRFFNEFNLFKFGNIPKGVFEIEYTYLGPEFINIPLVDKNHDTPISNWKGTPFRIELDSDHGKIEISIVENLNGIKSRVYLSYYFRDTEFPYLDDDYDVYDNNLLYESFKFWALIQSIKEHSDHSSSNPKAQLQFGTTDTLDFAVLVEADKLGELDHKIKDLITLIDSRQKEIFKEYQNKYYLKNMFK